MEESFRWLIIGILFVAGGIGTYFEDKRRKKRQQEEHRMWAERVDAENAKAQAAGIAPQPTIANYPPPSDPKLAAYMKDLPQAVRGISDAMRVGSVHKNNAKIGLWKTAIEAATALLYPNEFVYAIVWNAHCIITEKDNKNESHGVSIFSNARFLHYKDPANILEIPLANIYTVAAHKGQYFDGLAFRTTELSVEFSFARAVNSKLFHDMVIHIAANAACPLALAASSSFGVPQPVAQICDCPGCGATVIIHPGTKNKCEYCNRPVDISQPTTTAPSIATEIAKFKNLLDTGAITEEEFETIKARLLNNL